mgnify:CR=1 FL=1
MEWLLPALALVLIIEGIGPLLFPNKWRNYLLQISQQPSNQLRQIGGTPCDNRRTTAVLFQLS